MDDLIPVDVACNDDNGCVTQRAHAIHVPGMELAVIDMRGLNFIDLHGGGIRVSRRKWPARHLLSCVGNIYWERYGMEPWTAAAFLTYLRELKLLTIDGGYEELYAWWESGIKDDAYLRSLLLDAAKNDRL